MILKYYIVPEYIMQPLEVAFRRMSTETQQNETPLVGTVCRYSRTIIAAWCYVEEAYYETCTHSAGDSAAAAATYESVCGCNISK